MRTRTLIFLTAAGGALVASMFGSACYNPTYSSNEDAGAAFRCFATDKPTCPGNLVCCSGKLCGDALIDPVSGEAVKDSDTGLPLEGWCVAPRPPEDLTTTPFQYWPFPVKSMYYTGTFLDPGLSGTDPDTGKWRCSRDDQNPDPPAEIQRYNEPNDLPDQAINLGSSLRVDPDASFMGSKHEICPDKSAPDQADIDVFKFKVAQPTKVIVEVKYRLMNGDLDVGLFRLNKNADTGKDEPQLVLSDMTAAENACIEANNLPTGTYYIVVRGSRIIYDMSMPEKYTMNTYTLRAYSVLMSGASCMVKRDGGV